MRPRLRVLSLSTLFPAPPRPGFGKFVASQTSAVLARGDVELDLINPIGVPRWPLSRLERFRALAQCPAVSQLDGTAVHHVRFATMGRPEHNPRRIARALLPLAQRLHDEAPIDLVDAQFFFPDGPAAMIVADRLGVPYTIKARGSDIHHWSTRTAALSAMRRAARSAAGMLAVSAALKADMVALGFPADAIRVHYTGLDHARFRPQTRGEMRESLVEQFGIPAEGALLLVPGALIAIKGQALALEALAALPHARLALAGSGPDEARLQARVDALGLAGRVHFLGQVPHGELPMLMSAADVVVLPSEREGLANVWIEALACGTPLVIPPIGGASEVVASPDAGRLAAREPAAIARAVTELLDAPPSPQAVAACAARFSWARNAAELVEFWTRAAR